MKVEASHGVRILLAIESGSRAWGFPSPDSDYDVRFIYARPLDWYLSIQDRKDSLDFPINDDLDIGGWDIKKAMLLLKKSNAPLLEWVQSPIVYKTEEGFVEAFQTLCDRFYSPKAVMHHYLSMAKKYMSLIEESEDLVRLKTYFYALRATLAGQWIIFNDTMPPIEFSTMLPLVKSDLIRSQITALISLKGESDEKFLYQRNASIEQLLNDMINANEAAFADLPSSKGEVNLLDDFFRDVVLKNQEFK